MTYNPIDSIVPVSHQPSMPPWNWAECKEKSLAAEVKGTLHCTVRMLPLIRFTLEWCTDAKSLWNERQRSPIDRNPWPWHLCLLASKVELPPLQVLGDDSSLFVSRQPITSSVAWESVSNISSHIYPPLVVTLMKMLCFSPIHLRESCPMPAPPSALPVFWQYTCNQAHACTLHWICQFI